MQRVRNSRGHHNDLSGFHKHVSISDGNGGLSIEDLHKRVAGRGMGTQAFSLFKSKQRQAQGPILRESPAHHATFLVINEIDKNQGLRRGNILNH
jgi:hypothetical protein